MEGIGGSKSELFFIFEVAVRQKFQIDVAKTYRISYQILSLINSARFQFLSENQLPKELFIRARH